MSNRIPSAHQQALLDWIKSSTGNAGAGKSTTLVEATDRMSGFIFHAVQRPQVQRAPKPKRAAQVRASRAKPKA
jgi:hypothetical protein